MATVVERPISALSDMEASLQPLQPRRNPIEIIDVDAFDREASSSSTRTAFRPPNRRQRAQPEAISLLDSDDGDDDFVEILSPRLQPNHNTTGNRSRRQFVSTPRRDPSAPPPVPPVPHRYAGHTSMPRRRPTLPPPVSLPIVPNHEPFPFENSPEQPVAGPSTARAPAPQPAPPSHHTPSMGLGGALITSNRLQSLQGAAAAEREAQRRERAVARGPSMPLHRLASRHGNAVHILNDVDDDTHQRIHVLVNGFPGPPGSNVAFSWQDLAQQQNSGEAREKEQYQQTYTHPQPPEPGFTFDFEISSTTDRHAQGQRIFPLTSIEEPIVIDDDDQSIVSTSVAASSFILRESFPEAGKLNAVLVCARCMDPLILNADMNPEEAQLKRIWGLRCGHLIDEKCLNELGRHLEVEMPTTDKKGKGKSKAILDIPEPLSDPLLVDADTSSISSRLRSRISSASSALYSYLPSSHLDMPVQPSPLKKRRTASKKPKIEGEHEWRCPVASCGRVHVSVKVDGVWGPEKEKEPPQNKKVFGAGAQPPQARGAIPVFA